MKSPVQLYLRVRLPDETYLYLRAAYAVNIRPHHVIQDGKPVHFPSSASYLATQNRPLILNENRESECLCR